MASNINGKRLLPRTADASSPDQVVESLPNLTPEEEALWKGKKEFLVRKLKFTEQEASQEATATVAIFREFFAA